MLLETNEKIVEAIQLYDKLSRGGAAGTADDDTDEDDDQALAGKMRDLDTSAGELDRMQAEQRYRVERHNAHDDEYDDAGAGSSDDEEFLSRFASVDERALDPFADEQQVDVSPRKARQECESATIGPCVGARTESWRLIVHDRGDCLNAGERVVWRS